MFLLRFALKQQLPERSAPPAQEEEEDEDEEEEEEEGLFKANAVN